MSKTLNLTGNRLSVDAVEVGGVPLTAVAEAEASNVSLNNEGFSVLTGGNVQTAIEEVDAALGQLVEIDAEEVVYTDSSAEEMAEVNDVKHALDVIIAALLDADILTPTIG
jgi:hypothetical protein